MALFKKKTTLVHHITYMGIMAAINLIFIILATFVPPLMFLLILLLPFASTVVSYYCLKRYYIIYAVATICLCLLCSFNISDTIFYVVPAVVTGFVLGLLLEKKVHPFWLVLSSTIINAALTYAFIPLINLISNTDIVLSLLTIFKLQDFAYKTELVYVSIFVISLMQCVLSLFVILSDAKKIGIEINTRLDYFAYYIIGLELAIVLAITFSFFFLPLGLVFICISFCFGGFLLIELAFSKKLWVYLALGGAILAMVFVFAIFYKSLNPPYGIVLTVIFPLAIGAISFLNNCLLKRSVNN